MPPHDGLVPVMEKICKWYEFSGLFSHLSNNITSFGTLISRWGKYSWIFSFSRLRPGSSEGSGSPPRGLKFIFLSNYGNVHLIVHPSEIKLRHSPNQISKSSFSSWCWMTFTAVTVLVGRVLSWLQSPHAFELFSHLPHRQSHHHRQDRKCVKNVFPLATFPRVYSFAPRRG